MSLASVEAEQRAAQEDARENGEVLALARRASNAGTWDLDIQTGIVRYCPRSLEILGHPRDRSPILTAAEWLEKIFPGDGERVLAEGLQARVEGTDLITEYRIVDPDGGIRWVRGLGRTLLDADGVAVRSVGFNFDVTEEKKAEADFRALQSELIQASRANAMATMAETLAHELNQPLTALNSYLSGARTLLNKTEGDHVEPIREAFEGAIKASLRAAEIIKSLRAVTARAKGRPGSAMLDAAIAKAIELAARGADERGIRFDAELAPGLIVAIDDLQVQQVVYNLIRNAIDAVETAPVKRVSISCERRDGLAVIRIEDSGTGIPQSERGRLFDPFVTAKTNGAGIGLPISRTIIEAHGGDLWVEHLESGTAFGLTLPLAVR